jgi:twitching motility protein PilT
MTDIAKVQLRDVLSLARANAASDVHLVPGARAAIRVDGELRFLPGSALLEADVGHIAAAMFSAQTMERIMHGGEDASVARRLEDGTVLRVHGARTSQGPSVSVRLLPQTIPSIEGLGLPAIVSTFARYTRGLVLFCGPTGSGKSTSLAALVGEINRTLARRILTIEDPIEFTHSSDRSLVTQREVGRDAATFHSAVLGALRADPEVIVIGEMRDAETVRAALTAAETGHLVLTTLHTGSAVQAIDRIIDAFSGPEQTQIRAQLSHALAAVVSQRLVRCAQVKGRRVAVEVLIATDAVRSMIRETRTHLLQNAIATGRNSGMQTLEQHLQALGDAGAIDPLTALGTA